MDDGCDASRQCNYEIARAYCSEGNPAATAAMTACFRQDSGCHTPADPGTGDVSDCFESVIDEHGTSVSTAVRTAADEKCQADAWEPLMVEVFAVMAGSELAEGLQDCVEAADDCDAVAACVETDSGVTLPSSCE